MKKRASKIKTGSTLMGLFVALTLLICMASSATAAAKLIIHVNKGIGAATLGMREAAAIKAIGSKPSRSGRDTEYEGRVVYYKMFGKANKNGEYPLEVYSDTKRRVFMYAFNSPAYPTDAGIRVGSSEDALKKAYGSKLLNKPGRVYNHYWLGGKTGTDFFVKGGVVTQIIVRSY